VSVRSSHTRRWRRNLDALIAGVGLACALGAQSACGLGFEEFQLATNSAARDASPDAASDDAEAPRDGSLTAADGSLPTDAAFPEAGFVDIYGSELPNVQQPSAVVDTVNGKLLIATMNSITHKPQVFRCNVAGDSCVFADVSAGQGDDTGFAPRTLIDSASGKLLVITTGIGNKPSLFRCNLDATGCAFVDLAAGHPTLNANSHSAIVDVMNGKLLVVVTDGGNGNRPALLRCSLDGTGCTVVDISAGAPANSGYRPSLAIDSANAKLLVATMNGANGNRPSVFRCNLDGSGATHVDVSSNEGANSGLAPNVIVANGKLLVATTNSARGGRAGLFRCNADATGCAYVDIGAGSPENAGLDVSAVMDTSRGSLLVASQNQLCSASCTPALVRCNADGSSCAYLDMSAGHPNKSALYPHAVLDEGGQRLLVVTSAGLYSAALE
jgi:hypothetical protein